MRCLALAGEVAGGDLDVGVGATMAFSPSAMSRDSRMASISPRAHLLVVTGIVDFLP
jgi:hypothetical protein